ncbi:MAG: hypothetical protein Q6373_017300 [Candidatus Sigynarchaeota archaeon]
MVSSTASGIAPSSTTTSFSQQWSKVFDGNKQDLYETVLIYNQKIFLAGTGQEPVNSYSGAFYAKYSMDGVLERASPLTNNGPDAWRVPESIVQSGGNLYDVAHLGSSFSTEHGLLTSYDANYSGGMSIEWGDHVRNEVPLDLAIVGSDIYVCGYVDAGSNAQNATIMKFNSTLSSIMNASLDLGNNEQFDHIATSGTRIIVAGTITNGTTLSRDIIIGEFYPANSSFGWVTWGSSTRNEVCTGFAISGTSYYICGYCNDTAKKTEAFLVKLDMTCSEAWSVTWGGVEDDYAYALACDSSGVYIVGQTCSRTSNPSTDSQAFIAKYDGDGNLLGDTTWGGSRFDCAKDIAISGDIVVCCGGTNASSTDMPLSNAMVTKFTVITVTGSTPGVDGPSTVAIFIVSFCGVLFIARKVVAKLHRGSRLEQ